MGQNIEDDVIKFQRNVPIILEHINHITQGMEKFAMAKNVGVSELERNVS